MKGWIIIHPDGSIETTYFQATTWWSKRAGRNVTRRTWMKHYRPRCRMIQATLSWKDS